MQGKNDGYKLLGELLFDQSGYFVRQLYLHSQGVVFTSMWMFYKDENTTLHFPENNIGKKPMAKLLMHLNNH